MPSVVLGMIRLPATDTSAKAARDLAAAVARSWQLESDVEYRARLVTAELATNAIRYGSGSTIRVVVSRAGTRLRGEVHDGSVRLPVRQRPTPCDESGRGLILVEHVVTACGSFVTETGKAAWFEIEAKWPLDSAFRQS
ncbi:ATP-binding protein [Actinomadura barringtoniae]|uniref:ATP-binding protein n=1 Tax=Actinomadura barringtoniae TaxID=1427535 RepID=A0A939PF24_9ACTN|nr:ATP-binding protein [Actinomadura barringtoniae]MBO2451108.1 ATP-binding protein [Actinomadura barringtoniae]